MIHRTADLKMWTRGSAPIARPAAASLLPTADTSEYDTDVSTHAAIDAVVRSANCTLSL